MKKFLKVILSSILVAFMSINIINTLQVAAASEVTIADPVLRKAISTQLGKADGAIITDGDMLRLSELQVNSFSAPYLASLSGLEYATNLKELSITASANATFYDLSPLSALTKLESLYVNGGNISDLTPLQSLPVLKSLQVLSNNVSDLTPLKSVTSLTDLNFYDNKIQDITPLKDLTNLKELYLANNEIVNIDTLAFFPNLEQLSLNDNKITDISVLEHLTGLKILLLEGGSGTAVNSNRPQLPGGNLIDDFTPLRYLTNLEHLDLRRHYSKLTDISMLANLTNLTHLNLHHTNLENADAVQNMTKLTYLDMGDTLVQGLPDLSKLTAITELDLSDTPNLTNADVAKVEPLVTLEHLEIGGSIYSWSTSPLVTDISPLANLVNLQFLTIQGTGVEDISALASMTKLQRLGLDDNQISDIAPLADSLMNLLGLELNRNHISDLSILANSPSTMRFRAQNQKIELPTGTAGQPSAIVITDKNNTTPVISWITSGSYSNGELTWDTIGSNQLSFATADGLFSGTVKQNTVQATTSKITVKYVDENGTAIAAAAEFTGNIGNSETIVAKAISGYTLKVGQTTPQTITYTTAMQTIEFVYTADPVAVPVIDDIYEDETVLSGTATAGLDVEVTYPSGTKTTVTADAAGAWSLALTEPIAAGDVFQAVTMNTGFNRQSLAASQTVQAVDYVITANDVTMTISKLQTLQGNGTLEAYLIDVSGASAEKTARASTTMRVNIDTEPLATVSQPGVYPVAVYIANPNTAYNGSNALSTTAINITVLADPIIPVEKTTTNGNADTTEPVLPVTGTYELSFLALGAILIIGSTMALCRKRK